MTQQVNLYQDQFRPVRDPIGASRLVAIVFASLVVLASAWGWSAWRLGDARAEAARVHGALEARRTELAEVARAAGARRVDPALAQELARAETLHGVRTELMTLLESGVLGTPGGFSAQMRALARQSAAGLWLTGFDLSTGQVALQGRALSAELVPAYLRRLGSEKAMEGISFNGLRIAEPARQPSALAVAPGEAQAGKPAPSPPGFVEFLVSSDARSAELPSAVAEVRR